MCWRFHSVVLSIKFNIPFITFATTPKVKNILLDNDLTNLGYDINNIIDGCNYLKNNRSNLINKMKKIVTDNNKEAIKIYLNPSNYNNRRESAPFLINREDCNKIIKYITANYKRLSSDYDDDYNTELILFTLTKTINSPYN